MGSLAGLLPTVMLLARPAGAFEACAIVQMTNGDSRLGETIASLLEGHGVGTQGERCASSRAHVLVDDVADAAFVTVLISDGEGKEARRRIPRDDKTAAVVASLVESFVLGEDTDLLLRPDTVAPVETVAPPSRRWGQVGLLGGLMAGVDSSTWYGAQLDGCARVGRSCVGLRARFVHDEQSTMSDLVRNQWGGGVLWGIPFEGQRWQLLPAVALGVSYTRSSRFPAPLFRVSTVDYDLRGQLSLGLALFVTPSWAVRFDVAGEAAVALSHTSRQSGVDLHALLVSLVPEPPGSAVWLGLGLEYRR
jgi:hypothetical protein